MPEFSPCRLPALGRFAFGVCLLLLTSDSAIVGQALDLAAIRQNESGQLVTLDQRGFERWRGHWSIDWSQETSGQIIKIEEYGSGTYAPFGPSVRWQIRSHWSVSDRPRPNQLKRVVWDAQDHILLDETTRFDWEQKLATFQRKVEAAYGESVHSQLKVADNTWTPDGLPLMLRAALAGRQRRLKVSLLTSEPKIYSVSFRVLGHDTVSLGTDEHSAWKIRMDVDLGFLNLFKFLVPETFFWFSQDHPYLWLRYEGLESGRGTPKVVRQLLDDDTGG